MIKSPAVLAASAEFLSVALAGTPFINQKSITLQGFDGHSHHQLAGCDRE